MLAVGSHPHGHEDLQLHSKKTANQQIEPEDENPPHASQNLFRKNTAGLFFSLKEEEEQKLEKPEFLQMKQQKKVPVFSQEAL